MNIIPLTLVVSLGLATLFIALFAWELSHRRGGSAERESLLPLMDEQARVQPPGRTPAVVPAAPTSPTAR